MDRSNLKQRKLGWYARLGVPPELQSVIGKTEIVRTLKTRDLREANRRKHAVLAAMQEELSQYAAEATLPKTSAEYVLSVAKAARREMLKGEQTEEEAEAAVDAALEDHLDLMARKRGINVETGHPLLDETHERTLLLAHKVLHDGDAALLSKSLKTYLSEIKSRVRAKTLIEKERQLREFSSWLKQDCEVQTITRKLCGRYASDVLTQKGHAPKTIKDTLSNLAAFFEWLLGRGLIDFNPWRGVSKTIRASSRGTKAKRRPWTDGELTDLLTKLPTSDPLWAMTVIAAYSGMRREEVATLRAVDCLNGCMKVTEGKTAAAVRVVPVHPAIAPLVSQLAKKSSDGFLVPGLLTGGPDAKRSHYIGKRFSDAIRKLGFDDPALNFHTTRNSFMQRCEEAGVPESTVKLLVGHARQSLTFGTYSPGVQLDTLRQAVRKVSYGKLDALVKKLGRKVEIESKSRRRYKRAA
jgi:site-specific recombinase XerD